MAKTPPAGTAAVVGAVSYALHGTVDYVAAGLLVAGAAVPLRPIIRPLGFEGACLNCANSIS